MNMWRVLAVVCALSVLCAAEVPSARQAVVVATPGDLPLVDLLGESTDVWQIRDEPAAARRVWTVSVDSRGRALLDNIPGVNVLDVLVKNVDEMVDEHMSRVRESRINPDVEFLETFRDTTEIYNKMDELAQEFPDLVNVGVAGYSFENREVKYISVGRQTSASTELIFEGTAHAREWLATMTIMWNLINLFEEYKAGDDLALAALDTLVMHFIPVVNPDGLDYSFETDRLWRKNRRDNENGSYGVDLNRNSPIEHCGVGSSNNTRSDTYCGPSPMSESELQAVDSFLASHPNIKAYFSFHTYGNLLLRPYQVNNNISPDEELLAHVGQEICDAIEAVHGNRFDNIRGIQLYAHSGSAIDYAYTQYGLLAYTFELRGPGFVVPESTIKLSGEEVHEGFRAILRMALDGTIH